jgi:NitT/TauT family transport system substrate-binding protein
MKYASRWWHAVGLGTLLMAACAPGASPAPTPQAAAPSGGAAGAAANPAAQAAPAPAPAAKPAPEAVRVIYGALSGSQIPLWVAQDAGYFREQGLDVDLVFIESGTAMAQALVAGEAPLAHVGAASIVGPVAEGFEAAFILGAVNVPPLALFTRPDLQTPEGLRGARLAVTRFGSSTDVVGRMLLRRWNLEPERDVTVLQLGSVPEMLGALQTGAVDAAVLSDPTSLRAARLGYRNAADAAEMNVPYLHAGTVAPRTVIGGRPELVRRYLLGYQGGLDRFFADPALAIKTLGAYTRQEDAEILEITYQTHAEKYIARDIRPRAETLVPILASAENPKARSLAPESLVDEGPVRALQAEGLLPASR